MLRKRPPQKETLVSDDQEPPQKNFYNGKKAKHISLRVLASTLSAAVVAAVNPAPDVRSQAYSEYLTSQVHGLTIGWHVFRTVTEGAFLASYGLAFNTLVVQVFWSMSVGSVLMYFLGRSIWMSWRESICVWTNIIYGLVTVLKIFHLLDRLPNENHYMFKHCFLTMADAAFSQTPVHKQYAVQFAEAGIRVIVWRRYNVLANTPTLGVIIISIAWQIWLVTFSSMLQARHVSAFRRQRCASGSANPAPTSTPVTSRPASCEVEVAVEPVETCTPPASTSTGPTPPLALLAAAALPSLAPVLPLRPVRNRRSSIGASTMAAATGTAAVTGPGNGTSASCMQSPVEPLRLSSTAVPSSQKRFMRALRGVARGPSSYVLLSHQRRQVCGPHSASVQFYIPAANPDMLSGNWRERLSLSIAEGAPGWQVANMCVRKGSLIVHLDLVYVPRGREAAGVTAASPAITGPAALPDGVANNGDVGFPGVSYSEQPFDAAGACNPKAVLDEYIDGMGAECLMELLGLHPDLPAGPFQPVSVQINDQLWNLPIAPDTTTAPCTSTATTTTITNSTMETMAFQVEPEPVACDSSTAAPEAAPEIKSDVAPQNPAIATSARHEMWIRLVLLPLQTAMRPPADMRSSEYNCFLSERVAVLHLSYAAFICLTAVALPVVREISTVNPITLFLFISTELLTLASHLALGRGPWRSMRCSLVYVGVAMRTLQMAACTSGFLPHVLRDGDCISGRWIQKVMLITTLQALCMQSPVRSFFLVRMPSVMLSIYVHVFVCRTGTALRNAATLHLGWEGLLFYISAIFQLRHLEAFRRQRDPSGCCQQNPVTSAAKSTAEDKRQPPSCRVARKSHEGTAVSAATASGKSTTATLASSIPGPAAEDGKTVAADATVAAFVPVAAPGDPCDVSIDTPTLGMAPRRAARLQLHFTCAPAIVEELQVVLRHVNPVAMSSGVHSAHTVRDITRALVAPAGAAAAPLLVPACFTAELTLVASPADMPGLVHVELWRGRRRVCSHPVLLVATPEMRQQFTGGSAPRADMSADIACDAHRGVPGAEGAVGRDNACLWLDDVRRYVGSLRDQGHIAAADQFVEELGIWLAQAAALERGLTGNQNASTQRVANVLYFHGYGSEFMYVKPRRVSGCGGSGDEAAVAAAVPDPLQDTLRQLLLCQGSMLLAVAVEAGCIALSEHLMGLLMGEIGATRRGLLESTRTPVTQLPLLHAAVKSGDAQMVDLIAEWSTSCGMKDIWAHEAAVLAVSLESRASSAVGDTASLEAALQRSTGTGGGGFAAMARRPSRLLPHVAQDISRRTSSTFRAFEVRPSGGLVDAPADAGAEPLRHYVAGSKGNAESTNHMVAMDTGGSIYSETADSYAGPDLETEGNYLSEESPFKIIDFRASNRPAVSSMVAVSSVSRGGSSLASGSEAVTGPSETVVSDGSRSSGALGGGSSSGLVDGGVLVLTPLHISLALGDEGRLANHILRTYPEAAELWRTSHLDMEVEPAVNVGGGGSVRLEASTSAADSPALSPQPTIVMESFGSSTGRPANLAAVAPAYSSMPGLACLAKTSGTRREGRDGGDSMDADDATADDAMDVGSLKSISLSEVAFYEGIRWVNEDAPERRPGFKVVRM
ncbi:hypothetical protein Vafri_4496 [Volvox africanus]|uniref:Transmembrane protein n=1 Tax=Volvox africanus TaxID=51714 RepID=A0A8J4AVK8_9CHLO|nr:hypothetical protein Vafri_4496 [Volvox africanus]